MTSGLFDLFFITAFIRVSSVFDPWLILPFSGIIQGFFVSSPWPSSVADLTFLRDYPGLFCFLSLAIIGG